MCGGDLYSVVAGLLVGAANEDWLLRILGTLGWGLSWCVYLACIGEDRKRAFLQKLEQRGIRAKWGMSPSLLFYFTEYWIGVSTALPFALLAGVVRSLLD